MSARLKAGIIEVRTMRVLAVIVLLMIYSCSPPMAEHDLKQPELKRLARVPPADLSATQRAGTPEEWKNPFLVIRSEGIEMVTSSGSTGANSVSVDQMKEILSSLPEDAWPLGRIVAVTEISIRSGSDDQLIEANREALEKMLGELDVLINWWPSA
jgi:hypothetical protein